MTRTIQSSIIYLAIITLTGCATLRTTVRELLADTAQDLGGKLVEAVQDLDVEGLAKDQACGVYIARGRDLAEDIWTHDWPVFAPLFETTPSPAADLQWCRDQLGALGVPIVPHMTQETAAQAQCTRVLLPQDFDERSIESQAATTCHEFVHIVGQKRMDCAPWLVEYAKASGRLATEGTAYALGDALLERYGVPAADIARIQKRRAKRFPERYRLSLTVDSKCVLDYFAAIRGALRERGGV